MSNTSYKLKQLNPTNIAAMWMDINPILLKGEIAFESDTRQFKIGDGITPWNELPYGRDSSKLIMGDGVYLNALNDSINATLLYTYVEAPQ